MGTIFIILIIVFFIFIIIGAVIANTKPVTKSDNSIRRTEVEINLKEYPNHYSFSVSGVHLPDYCYPVFNICKEFDLITLVPEPDNSYDSDAIKVEDSGWHIGYVPAGETSEVHEIINKDHIAYIESRNLDGYIAVHVKIRYK